MAKHFVTTITDDAFTFRRDAAQVAAEQALDGLYIVRANVEPDQFDAAQTVRAYKDLAKVERVFRCLKSVDLKVRPIHRRRPDRLPVHSFRTLLTDLGTLTANTMQVADGGGTFTLQTQPTPVQQRCFELLGVTPRL